MADTTSVELSAQELRALEDFRKLMSEGAGPGEAVSVVHESLGSTPQGEKVQFRGGKEGWTPEPAPKGLRRWQLREQRRLEAKAAAAERARKNHKTVMQRVAAASEALAGRNANETIQLIQQQSPAEAQVYVLAEEQGQNRKTVLDRVTKVTQKLRQEYQAELAVAADAADQLEG